MLRSIREEINDEDDDDNGDNGNDHDDGYREFCISRKESTNSKRVLIQRSRYWKKKIKFIFMNVGHVHIL